MPASAFRHFIQSLYSVVVFCLVKAFVAEPKGYPHPGYPHPGRGKATELRSGLRVLQLRVGLSHNTRARVQHRLVRADLGAAQHQRPLAVTLGIHVADQAPK